MKKSLLALAVLGAFAGTASAQSSVTIYGLLDMSVAKSNNDGIGVPFAPNAGAPANDAWTVQQSAGSRLGFRGNEDMGGGLSAQFQIEHRFNPDTGTPAATFWQGRSYVQLTSAAAGSVYLGREYTPAFWPAVKSDPFGWDGVGQLGANQWAGYLTRDPSPSGNGVRSSNTVGYRSPNWGGLTVQAAFGLSEGPTQGRNNGFNVEYAGGPIYAGVGYESITDGIPANNKNGVINGAFHWDFGFLKLMAYYAQAKNGTNGTVKGNVYSLGARIPLAGGVIKAAYLKNNPDKSLTPLQNTKLGIGYDYPLSKRTNVYADFGRGTGTSATNVKLQTNNAYAFGVKHTF